MLEGSNAIGQAVVYDTSASLNTYSKLLQKQQAQRAAEQKALQDELSKVKLDGVRDADKPLVYEKYNEWKDAYSKLITERDPYKKMLAQDEFDRKGIETADIADKSRNYAKLRQDVNVKALSNDFLDNFEENGWRSWMESDKKPITDPSIILDPSSIERRIDLSKVNTILDKDVAETLKESTWGNPREVKGKQGNREGVWVSQERAVDPKKLTMKFASRYDLQPEIKVALRKMYPEIYAQDPENFKANVIPQLVRDRHTIEPGKPEFKANDTTREDALFREGLVRGRPDKDGTKETPETVRQDLVAGLVAKDGKARNIVQAQVIANPEYGGKNLVIKSNKNGTTTYEVPAKLNADGEVKQNAYKVTIEEGKEASAVALNQLLNDVTGENIPYGGYKGVKGNKNINPTSSKPKAKISQEDQAALDWANANPKDPRAIAIKKTLKAKGL